MQYSLFTVVLLPLALLRLLHYSALEVFLNDMRYINPRFTYLLTYLLTYTVFQNRKTLVSK